MGNYLAPGVFVRKIANPIAKRLGVAPVLSVRTRKSGGVQRTPVQVLEHESQEYLVSARGESDWVKNLRRAGQCDITYKGRTRHFQVTEVPVDQRQPILAAYQRKWGSDVKKLFASLPDAAEHPIFLLLEG
jgi:deazaflavin-dependent oxidoreductase (nitroreductase family)